MARGETELGAAFPFGPRKHGGPKDAAEAVATSRFVDNEIFEISDFADDGSHDDGEGGDTIDFAIVIDGDEEVVRRGSDEVVEPLFWNFAAVFVAAGELN